MTANILLILINLFYSCGNESIKHSEIKGYNLSSPNKTLVLPDILNEVSGLTVIDSSTIGCVQDENGILFIYDITHNKIKSQYSFNIDGDYEGIALVGKTMYVLRSDGTLFEISDYESKNYKLQKYVTGIPANNNEGLCHDADHNRLLIACKSKLGKGPELKDKRAIYSFDLSRKKLIEEPVFYFDVATIKQYAVEKNLELPERSKKKGVEPVIKFFTSAIAIHPISKKLYLLSAADHMLFIFDMNGKLEHLEQLEPKMFNKPEGISFLDDGDMLITNEAQNLKPTLLRFEYNAE